MPVVQAVPPQGRSAGEDQPVLVALTSPRDGRTNPLRQRSKRGLAGPRRTEQHDETAAFKRKAGGVRAQTPF